HALSGPPQDQPQVVILRRNSARDHVTHEPVRVVILLTKYVPGRLSVQTLQQPINEIVLVRPNLGNSNLVRHATTALRPPLLERPEPPPRLRLLVVANQCANATDSTGNTSPSGRNERQPQPPAEPIRRRPATRTDSSKPSCAK